MKPLKGLLRSRGVVVALLAAVVSPQTCAWNDEGHMVVAQIACQQMTALTRPVALAGYRLAALLNEMFR